MSHTYATAIRRKKFFVVDMKKVILQPRRLLSAAVTHKKKLLFFKNPALFIFQTMGDEREKRRDNKRRLIECSGLLFLYYNILRIKFIFFSFLIFSVLGFCKSKGDFHVATTFPPFIVRVLLCPPTLLI